MYREWSMQVGSIRHLGVELSLKERKLVNISSNRLQGDVRPNTAHTQTYVSFWIFCEWGIDNRVR